MLFLANFLDSDVGPIKCLYCYCFTFLNTCIPELFCNVMPWYLKFLCRISDKENLHAFADSLNLPSAIIRNASVSMTEGNIATDDIMTLRRSASLNTDWCCCELRSTRMCYSKCAISGRLMYSVSIRPSLGDQRGCVCKPNNLFKFNKCWLWLRHTCIFGHGNATWCDVWRVIDRRLNRALLNMQYYFLSIIIIITGRVA